MPRFISQLICAVFALFVPAAIWSQVDQSTISGTVTDASGAAVPGVRLVVRNVQTGIRNEVSTNAAGLYRAPYLQPGRYEVSAEKSGFDTARVTGIALQVGLIATIDLELQTASVRQEVTVEARGVMLEQQSASLGNVMDNKQIVELPLLGRNPYALVTLAPGVLPAGNAGTGPVIDGGRSQTSAVLLDGAETRSTAGNGITFSPSVEAVQEFKVITNSFSAEYGRSGGGVLTAVGKSGTNQLHGSVYEFLRNDKLNANGWTNNRSGLDRSAFRRNEYGFAVGGPVLIPKLYNGHNKTFFFFNWEQTPQRSPDNLIATVPTALQRAGDFSQTLTGGGAQIRIFDPSTTRPDPAVSGQYIRDQFPGNRIPASRFDPVALRILDYFPMANRNSLVDNYVAANSRKNDTTKYFYRLDHNIGMRNRLFFRHGLQDNLQNTLWPDNVAFPGEGNNAQTGLVQSRNQSGVLSDTTTFAPNLIGEFRASFNRTALTLAPRSIGYDYTKLGLPAYLKSYSSELRFPEIAIADLGTNIAEGTTLGPARASHGIDNENVGEAQGHLTWIKGSHSVKGGYDQMFLAFNVSRPDWPSGDFTFTRAFTQGPNPNTSGATTGYGVATLLLGAPTGGSFGTGGNLAASRKYYGSYIQDDWKIRRNLSVNLGVRWEYETPYTERYNRLAFFDPNATDPLTGRKGLLRFVGKDGASRFQTRTYKKNFMPRLGLEYQFLKDTVLRIGYGLSYFPGNGGIGAGPGDLGDGFQVRTPVYLGQAPAAPNTPPPGSSLANPFLTGILTPPTNLVGNGVGSPFPDWTVPSIHQWNINIQRSLTKDMVLEAAYIGSRGKHIWFNFPRDAANPSNLSLGNQLNDLVPNPFFGIITTGSLSAPTVRRSALLTPYPQYTGVTQTRASIGDSIYHGATLKVDKRMGHGLLFQGAYTFSKLIDNVPERFVGRTSIANPYDLGQSRSIGDQDRSQYLVMNWVYELPFGPGKSRAGSGLAGTIIGSWQVSGVASFGSGLPVVITTPCNTGLPGIGCYSIRSKSPILPGGQQSIDRWFDTSAFSAPPPFSLGNDSRSEPNLRTPGIKNWDLGLSRSQVIRERVRVQFRAEFFGAFNTPQFNAPSSSVTATNFGQITSAGGARNIQLGIRLSY